ncbi:lymphocyte cytosolic protein 2 [Dromiciops gliroides]|uniref:lymphocyte cytosolic protein 2 n=1 Tax=Dromiciops gliroides TaxID=33562 RepID=UPI001CC4CEA3|nr:lymphocyte cytosolic protein 2 [Dromiciops gliroides]
MALSNVPYRSEVLAWGPDELADYFKKLNYKDCEKVVKKHHISGPRFLNLSENDIQKFPKLRVPILSKLSQEINKNEERRSLFARKPHPQRFPDERDMQEEDDGGWSSFEEDDYESPNEDQDGEDDGDYESPSEEVEPDPVDDADYEPPPSNDEDAMQNTILPAKIPTGSMYIDRPPAGKIPQQPPVPPQRPLPAIGGRNNTPPNLLQSSHEEPIRGRNHRTPNFPAPSIDRSKKPPLDRTLPQFERDSLGIGKKPVFPDKPLAPALRTAGDHLPKIPKPPLPPAERPERNFKKPPVPKPGWGADRRGEEEDDVHHRPLPHPAIPSFTSNTFPSRSNKPPSKLPQPGSNSMPGPITASNFPTSASLPPYLSKGGINRLPSRGPAEGRPLPVPMRQRPPSLGDEENSLNNEWYVSYITRPEAEAALRKINKDGTFLVRDSSKKTVTNPYVLMVLYKNKVYNIQIRYNEESQVYLLGTGLRGKEDFLSVPDIIDYFRKMPLLLIDGKNRDSRNQCMLIYAAGYP